MVAIDKPDYMNVIFHRECYQSIDNISVFINENYLEILKNWKNSPKNTQKSRM